MIVKDLVHNDETRIPTINKDCDGATIADKNKIIECVSSNMKKIDSILENIQKGLILIIDDTKSSSMPLTRI